MSAFAQLAIALVIFVAGLASGVKYHAGVIAQRDLVEHEATAKAAAKRADRIDTAAAGHESDKAALRTEFLTITQEVQRVIEKPVYRNLCFDDDGVRLVNAAAGVTAAASEPAPAVPGSGQAQQR